VTRLTLCTYLKITRYFSLSEIMQMLTICDKHFLQKLNM